MPSKPYPTRRRVLLAGALAATGFALDEAMAEPLPPTPQCHDGDRPWLAGGKANEVFMSTDTEEGTPSHQMLQVIPN